MDFPHIVEEKIRLEMDNKSSGSDVMRLLGRRNRSHHLREPEAFRYIPDIFPEYLQLSTLFSLLSSKINGTYIFLFLIVTFPSSLVNRYDKSRRKATRKKFDVICDREKYV